MEDETQIVLISQSGSLQINFSYMLDVKNKRIALLSLQAPDVEQNSGRFKRIIKDPSLYEGGVVSVFVHCDEVHQNTFVNISHSNTSHPMKCLDILQLTVDKGHNSIQIQNPRYHTLNASSLLSLKVELRDYNGELMNFHAGNIILKLGIK